MGDEGAEAPTGFSDLVERNLTFSRIASAVTIFLFGFMVGRELFPSQPTDSPAEEVDASGDELTAFASDLDAIPLRGRHVQSDGFDVLDTQAGTFTFENTMAVALDCDSTDDGVATLAFSLAGGFDTIRVTAGVADERSQPGFSADVSVRVNDVLRELTTLRSGDVEDFEIDLGENAETLNLVAELRDCSQPGTVFWVDRSSG